MGNMSNNNSIWFAVDESGAECWSENKPHRIKNIWSTGNSYYGILFPGAIKAITGCTLTWQDEPMEWKPGEQEKRKSKNECKNKVYGSCPLPNIYCKYPDCENQ